MRLTPQQLGFFDTFGYLAFPRLLSDRIGAITEEFETLWAAHGGGHAGKPHDGQGRSCLAPCVDRSEYLSTLLDDERIEGIAASLLGEDFNYTGSDGNLYAGDTGWHSDGWSGDLLAIKIAFYLDPVSRDTGCLRVIPGSHKTGEAFADTLHRDIGRIEERWGVPGRELPCVALETVPGDVVLFNHNFKHAAYGGASRRRMFTMNFGQRVPDYRLQELRDGLAGAARFWAERAYGEAMIRTAGPRRMRHLEQLLANDGHLPELARKAREAMHEPARG